MEELVEEQAKKQKIELRGADSAKYAVQSVCTVKVPNWELNVNPGTEEYVDIAMVLWSRGYVQWIRLDEPAVLCSTIVTTEVCGRFESLRTEIVHNRADYPSFFLLALQGGQNSEMEDSDANGEKGVAKIMHVENGNIVRSVVCSDTGQLHILSLQLQQGKGYQCILERSFEVMRKRSCTLDTTCVLKYHILRLMFQVKGPVHAIAASSNGVVAVGGKGNELRLYDSKTSQNMFKVVDRQRDFQCCICLTDISLPHCSVGKSSES